MSTFAKLRVGPKGKGVLAGVPILRIETDAFDPIDPQVIKLPAGAILATIHSAVGTLNQAADTLDIGTTADAEDIKSELVVGADATEVLYGGFTLSTGELHTSTGATNTGTGTISLSIEYYLPDALSGVNE